MKKERVRCWRCGDSGTTHTEPDGTWVLCQCVCTPVSDTSNVPVKREKRRQPSFAGAWRDA